MDLHLRAFLRSGINGARRLVGAEPLREKGSSARDELKQAGQIIVIFVLMLTVFIGLMGIAIDATYAWRESLRVQRAADAASLAGVVYEPGADATAQSTAILESAKNGFPITGLTTIAFPDPVPANPRELDVTISTPVPTFFSRIFGINSWTVTRSSKAIYVTKVPMGSPQAFYGVYQMCTTTGSCTPQLSPTGVSVSSQGFFGAIEGEGSNRSTGDAFATYFNGMPTVNGQYSADGYRYTVVGGSTGGIVYLYDPMFCATSTKAAGGHAGAGDHWLGPNPPIAVDTFYILWDTLNTPLAPGTWKNVAELDELGQTGVDKSNNYGAGGNYGDNGSPANQPDCQNSSDHNKWVALGAVKAGEAYSLQVTTTDPASPSSNRDQSFENMFSIAVSGTGAQVYGNGFMETYANVDAGSQEFYLAQIDAAAGAGKTVEIDLFDPGDTGKASWLQVEPDGTGAAAWQPATFSYTADNGRSNASTNCLQTNSSGGASPPSGCGENATGGGNLYDNTWVHVLITLPTTYGDASHPLANTGWWKIKYIVNGANDTTTWQVSINGNPVHLI
jgi:hypothetical protein